LTNKHRFYGSLMNKPRTIVLSLFLSLLALVSCIPLETSTTPSYTSDSSPTPTTSAEGTLTVHFVDVGQGDAILIDLHDIEVLIDGGGRSPGVVSYLNNYVNGALEVMIATRPHADHIGGLIDVLAAFRVDEIWHNGETSTSQTYSDFINAINFVRNLRVSHQFLNSWTILMTCRCRKFVIKRSNFRSSPT